MIDILKQYINKAIAKANEKDPTEALQVDIDDLADVQTHCEYLADHEAINEKLICDDLLQKTTC
jgi:hypothetical protein